VPERLGPERPLSAAGRQEVENVVRLLAAGGARVANVVHSGKLRAQQTAELLATALAAGRVPEVIAGLSPNDPVEPWCDKGPRLLAAPRTDPGERHYRTELLPRIVTSNRQSHQRRAGISGWATNGLPSASSSARSAAFIASRVVHRLWTGAADRTPGFKVRDPHRPRRSSGTRAAAAMYRLCDDSQSPASVAPRLRRV
jgi:hypothetical protein